MDLIRKAFSHHVRHLEDSQLNKVYLGAIPKVLFIFLLNLLLHPDLKAATIESYSIQLQTPKSETDPGLIIKSIKENPKDCEKILDSIASGDQAQRPSILWLAFHSTATHGVISKLRITGEPGEIINLMPSAPVIRKSIHCALDGSYQSFDMLDSSLPLSNRVGAKHSVVIPAGGVYKGVQYDYSTIGPIYPYMPASESVLNALVYQQTLYLLMVGGIFVLASYSGFLWLGSRKYLFKVNALYLASLFIQQCFVGDGYGLLMNIVAGTRFDQAIIKLMDAQFCSSGFFGCALSFMFLISYLDIDKKNLLIYFATRSTVAIALFAGFASLFISIVFNETVIFAPVVRGCATFGAILNILVACIYCYKQKSRITFIYTLSVIVLSVGAGIYVSYLDGTLPLNIWTKNSLLIASFLEALLLSVTVGYQVRREEMKATEVKDRYYAKLGASNAELLVERARLRKEVRLLLDGVPLGILSIELHEGALRIAKDFSLQLPVVLGIDNVEMVTFNRLLKIIGVHSEQSTRLRSSLMSSLGEDELAWEMNSDHYPQIVKGEAKDNTNRFYRLTWSPYINSENMIEKVLVTISDETDLQNALQETEVVNHKIQIIGELHLAPPVLIATFMASAHTAFNSAMEILTDLKGPNADGRDYARELFMIVHTLKGEALSLGLSNLADAAHHFETSLSTIDQRGDSPSFNNDFDLLVNAFKFYEDVYREISGRSSTVGKISVDETELRDAITKNAIESLVPYINKPALNFFIDLPSIRQFSSLARTLEKPMQLIVKSSDVPHFVDIKYATGVDNVISHLLRNAADHGIESPRYRLLSGKGPIGRITITITSQGFVFEDDGAGFNLKSILMKARSKGFTPACFNFPEDTGLIDSLIFEPGFSTKSDVSLISGRGVGMDAVRSTIHDFGGAINLNITSFDDRYAKFYFSIIIPNLLRIDQRSKPLVSTVWKSEIEIPG